MINRAALRWAAMAPPRRRWQLLNGGIASSLPFSEGMHRILIAGRRYASANSNADAVDPSAFEELHHLAKQLSRPSENARLNHRSWVDAVRRFDCTKKWSRMDPVGLQNYNFSGYEHEGLAEIHSRSYDAPVLLEIRDVRVPASSHHPSFSRLARHRVHLICYTHADLIDAPTRDRVERWTAEVWPKSLCTFVDTREGKSRETLRIFDNMYDGLLRQLTGSNVALTVGVANVGKSSVLTALLRLARDRGEIPKQVRVNKAAVSSGGNGKKRKKKKVQMGKGSLPDVLDTPGKTRHITEYLLRAKPRAYFMDVPGITPPPFFFRERPQAWFGYGATNLLPMGRNAQNDAVMHRAFCDYVLSCANRDRVFLYVDKLNLSGPTDSIDEALSTFAGKKYQKLEGQELLLKRCQAFLKLFNTGNFGPLILDDMRDTSWEPFKFRDEHYNRARTKQT